MKTVYKYQLPLSAWATIRLPKGADVLSVGCQGEELFLWCLVDQQEEKTVERTFRIAGTGHNLNLDDYRYFLGTAFMHDASLVWHVFEAKP